jgi:uncharacterized repeat protein (TIGR01451 family)
MKKINFLIVFVFCFITSLISKAQTGFILTSLGSTVNSVQNCNSYAGISIGALSNNSNNTFNLVLNGNNFTTSQFNAIVNWGDGNVTSHNGSVFNIGSNIQWTPSLYHSYSNPGSYSISIQLTNLQNNTSVSTNLTYVSNTCYTLSAYTMVDCNNDGQFENTQLSNVPFAFSGSNGNEFDLNGLGGSIWYDVTIPGEYTVSIDPNWLLINNYIVSTVSDTVITALVSGYEDTAIFILNCNTSTQNLCVNGTVFCDDNMDGIQNSPENVMANIPVNISTNGMNYTVYTNNNGEYNLTYPDLGDSLTYVGINNTWLAQNNTISSDTAVLGVICPLISEINIPLICPNSYPYSCAAASVFCDLNGNNVFDNGEYPLQNAPVTFYNGLNPVVTAYSDSNGYAMVCGNYFPNNIITSTISTYWLNQHGYTTNNNIISLTASDTIYPVPALFAINCNGNITNPCADLWTTVTPWIGYLQGNVATIRLKFGNYGPISTSGYTVSLSFPQGVTPLVGSINIPGYSISGNTISWNINNSTPGSSTYDLISFNIPSGLLNGALHFYTSNIQLIGVNTDCNSSNNSCNLLQILGNSYDPNDKIVDHVEELNSVVTEKLNYTIRFQNTGTAPAQNIHILDTLSSKLDWTSFELIHSSHDLQVIDLGNGVRRFEFPNIWLPDSTTNEPLSHGFLMYSLKELDSNGDGDEIFNTAYIYFDWNPAIITNTTYNINGMLDIDKIQTDYISIFPNPTMDLIHISGVSKIEKIELLGISGEIIEEAFPQSLNAEIDASKLSGGIYFVRIQMEQETITKKVCKK